MAWFARDRRQKVPSHEIAEDLFHVMVEEEPRCIAEGVFLVAEEDPDPTQPGIRLPRTLWPQFRARMRLYREATVLMVLLSKAHVEPKYEEVLKSYERLIFPVRPTPDAIAKQEALRAAMQDISQLVDPQGDRKALSWSAAWLNGMGHAEINPINLSLCGLYWMGNYTAVAGALKELRPI